MKLFSLHHIITFVFVLNYFQLFSQTSPENIKTALVYNIADCVKWNKDTLSNFTIGILSDNEELIDKFKKLSRDAKINRKSVQVKTFSNINSIRAVHLLYIDFSYIESFSLISQKISMQNTLIVSDEYEQPGDIMINLKLNEKTQSYTFEYNRANILFQGLDLTDEIVLLKGTEIEIRKLYLQAKKLWDEQKALTDSLKVQSKIQNRNLKIQKDSMLVMKTRMGENINIINEQINIIAIRDSASNNLNLTIKNQQKEISKNKYEIVNFKRNIKGHETIIIHNSKVITDQKTLSDSLTNDIKLKSDELKVKQQQLGIKEITIQKQMNWLLISSLIIGIVIISILMITRAYFINKRAKQKIARQKEELETIIEQLNYTQQQLIQSEKLASLGVLVAGIAHEINNPINFINAGIAGIEKLINKILVLLKELKKLTPESTNKDIRNLLELKNSLNIKDSLALLPEVFEDIKIGIKRTIEITNGLRLYARINKEEKSSHNINEIIDTALLLLKHKITTKIEITKNYETLPQIMVFPGKLSQVFINILSNAIDSISEKKELNGKGNISIKTSKLESEIVIEFSDTGIGIPQANINKLFDPFYTTKIVGKGTGLGLSISMGIIEDHLGKLYVKNNLPAGAIFIIELPVNQ